MNGFQRSDAFRLALALTALAAVTITLGPWLHVSNAATVSTTYLTVLLLVAATSRLRAGPGVAGTVFRTARHMALSSASAQELSGGRFVLGCGVSHQAYADELGISYPVSALAHARASVAASATAGSVLGLVLRCRNRVRMLLMAGYRVSADTADANASPRWP